MILKFLILYAYILTNTNILSRVDNHICEAHALVGVVSLVFKASYLLLGDF